MTLKLPAKHLNGHFTNSVRTIRLNHYPACPSPDLALGVGATRTKDPSRSSPKTKSAAYTLGGSPMVSGSVSIPFQALTSSTSGISFRFGATTSMRAPST